MSPIFALDYQLSSSKAGKKNDFYKRNLMSDYVWLMLSFNWQSVQQWLRFFIFFTIFCLMKLLLKLKEYKLVEQSQKHVVDKISYFKLMLF